RRGDPAKGTGRAAIAICLAALSCSFCLLSYREFGARPGFLFIYIFLAEAGLICLAFFRARSALIVPLAGGIVFAFLATWTGYYLTDALLWWALGGYVVFSIVHAGFAVWPKAVPEDADKSALQNYLPLLPLALIWICVAKNE